RTRALLAEPNRPRLLEPISPEEAVADGPLWLDPHARSELVPGSCPVSAGARVDACLIGPEGGPSPRERALLVARCAARRLGERIMRTEVAAVAATARIVLGRGV